MSFPSNLKRIRKKFRMNQEEFGRLFGRSRDQIKRLESGQMEASISFAVRLEELSGITVKQLFATLVPEHILKTYPLPPEAEPETMQEPPEEAPKYRKPPATVDVNELLKAISELKNMVKKLTERINRLEEDKDKDTSS